MCFKNNFAENPASNQKINAFFFNKYRNYCDVFDWKKANELLLHHQHNHWIKLTDEGIPLWNKIYSLSGYKLQKIKKYIAENFKKDFIKFSKVLYFILILFTLKANRDLQFCINYQELNIIIKHNCYFISLINEMFA